MDYLPNEHGQSQRKVIRAQYNENFKAFLSIEKECAILAGDKFNMVEVTSNGVNIQTSPGKQISVQTMSQQGPFHSKMFFPFTLLPGPFSPPQEIPMPPLFPLLPQLAPMAGVFAALATISAVV